MDAIPGANPAEGLKKIADEMKAKFDEAGMGSVDSFVDTLEEVKEMVEKGPAGILEKMQGLFNDFKAKMQELMDNPASIAPGGGAIAACGAWYGNAVVAKLGDLNKETEKMLQAVKDLVSQIQEPMDKLGETLKSAMSSLEGTVKKLAKLPSEVMSLADTVKGPEEVANIDTDPMKKCLDTSGISSPLDALAGLKGPLKSAIEAVKVGVDNLVDFLESVPDKVKAAFDVPMPLCFMTQMLLAQAPEAMTQLLDMVDGMKKLDMAPMKRGLGQVRGTICDLNPETVSEPVKKFAESAKEQVESLDKMVSGAKLASGGGVKDALKAVPGIGKLF